jgi:hypothetical protein
MKQETPSVVEVQHQIRANASQLQDYFSDLYAWEKTSARRTWRASERPRLRPNRLPRPRHHERLAEAMAVEMQLQLMAKHRTRTRTTKDTSAGRNSTW